MSVERGSFGLTLPDWEITPTRVTVKRSWRPAVLAPLLLVGVYLVLLAFDGSHRGGEGKLFIMGGVLCGMLGLVGVAASPLRAPSKIVVTGDEVVIGSRTHPADDVREFGLDKRAVQQQTELRLMVDFKSLMPLYMVLARRADQELDARSVIDAMNAVLRKQPPTLRVRATVGADGTYRVDARDAPALQEMLARATPPQWAPEGANPKVLTEALSEPRWSDHLAHGTVVERARYGTYRIVAIDASERQAGAIGYTWRIFVLPADSDVPVLAVNVERSMMGTLAYGVHRGGAHVNYGECPADLEYDAFRTRAQQILGEELLIS